MSERSERRVRQASRNLRQEVGLRAWLNTNEGVLAAIGLVGLVVSVGFFFGSWYMKSSLREELKEHVDSSLNKALAPIRKEVGEMRGDIVELRAGLANIQGRLGSIAGIVYKERASALGIDAPQIVPIQLSESSATAPSAIRMEGTFNDGTTLQLEFEIKKLTQDSITFLINGNARKGVLYNLHNVEVTLSRQVGVPVELNKAARV